MSGDELKQAQGAALNLLFGAVEVRAECVDELFQVKLFEGLQVGGLLQGGGCAGFEHVLQHGLGESDGGAGLCGEDSHELPEACPVFCVGGLQVGVDGVERSRVKGTEIAGQAAQQGVQNLVANIEVFAHEAAEFCAFAHVVAVALEEHPFGAEDRPEFLVEQGHVTGEEGFELGVVAGAALLHAGQGLVEEKDQVFGGIAAQVTGTKQHVAGFPDLLRARPRVRQALNETQNPLVGAFGGAEQERVNQLLIRAPLPEQGAHGAAGGTVVFPRVTVGGAHERPGNVGGKRGAVNVVATDDALGGEGSGEGGAFLLGGAGDDGVVFLHVS